MSVIPPDHRVSRYPQNAFRDSLFIFSWVRPCLFERQLLKLIYGAHVVRRSLRHASKEGVLKSECLEEAEKIDDAHLSNHTAGSHQHCHRYIVSPPYLSIPYALQVKLRRFFLSCWCWKLIWAGWLAGFVRLGGCCRCCPRQLIKDIFFTPVFFSAYEHIYYKVFNGVLHITTLQRRAPTIWRCWSCSRWSVGR